MTTPPSRPLSGSADVGISQEITNANSDAYILTVPPGATGMVIWFQLSEDDETIIGGRMVISEINAEITPITNTSTNMGNHPPTFVEHRFRTRQYGGRTVNGSDRYVHLAVTKEAHAGAVVKGYWTFVDNDGE